jgi:quercetin dioxygenase-like cupin family protein
MTWTARRVVTGHDEKGLSVFLEDGPPPVVRDAPDGAAFHEIWNTAAMPAPIAAAEEDPTQRSLTVPPDPNGTKIRINVFPPGVISPMHRTATVDYGIVLEGQVVLVLDDEKETVLHPGDVVIQRGTMHRWENRSDTVVRMVFVLVDGVFTDELAETIGSEALASLLHDPMRSAPQLFGDTVNFAARRAVVHSGATDVRWERRRKVPRVSEGKRPGEACHSWQACAPPRHGPGIPGMPGSPGHARRAVWPGHLP